MKAIRQQGSRVYYKNKAFESIYSFTDNKESEQVFESSYIKRVQEKGEWDSNIRVVEAEDETVRIVVAATCPRPTEEEVKELADIVGAEGIDLYELSEAELEIIIE
jgi:hypothetical protein